MKMLQKTLFQIAKSPWMGNIVGMAFQYVSWAIPVRRIIANKDVVVFRHPQPCYQNHIILSPKKPIQNLQQMAAFDANRYFAKIWAAAMEVCEKHPDVYASFGLIANGGKRQEVQQVHFHMFTNHTMVSTDAEELQNEEKVVYRDECLCIFENPQPEWDVHLILKPVGSSLNTYFNGILHCIDLLDALYSIVQNGYSVVYQHSMKKNGQKLPVFHIVSGAKHK